MEQTFNSVEEYQAFTIERAAKREAMFASIEKTFTETVIPSDKLGQLWKVTRLGDVEIMREYVPDPGYDPDAPDGTFIKPYAFAPGMTVELGKFYTDGEDIWECVQAGVADAFTAPWFDVIAV